MTAQQELRIATFRRGAELLVFPAILLVVVAGVVGYLYTNLPDPYEDWMLLSAAGALVLLAVALPWWIWASRTYILTTRRIIVSRGLLVRRRSELLHATGYRIEVVRGPIQRLFGRGTLILSSGGVELALKGVHSPRLVRETLSDQIEICQILAHRQAQQAASDAYMRTDS